MLDMHSLTDMVDHIQLIIKTLQVFDIEIVDLKQNIKFMAESDPELNDSVRILEDKLNKLTDRSEHALRMVNVRYYFIHIRVNLFPARKCGINFVIYMSRININISFSLLGWYCPTKYKTR